MPSQRKINSTRTNGAKSRGPKTEAGRRKSAMNALTHGLSPEQYQALLDAYTGQFHPDGQAELHLIEEMVAVKWRQRRLWAIEADLLDDEIIVQKKRRFRRRKLFANYPAHLCLSRSLRVIGAAIPHPSRIPPTIPPKSIDERTQSQMRTLPHTPAPFPEAPLSIDLPPCARSHDEHPLALQKRSV
jgi:hypothetical protein